MNIFRNMLCMVRRFKTATALNFLGLVIAFATCYVLWTQVDYARNYNKCIPESQRVYRLEGKMGADANWGVNMSRGVIDLISNMPEVEMLGYMNSFANDAYFTVNGSEVKGQIMQMNGRLFEVAGAKCLSGKLSFLTEQGGKDGGVVIPASLAMRAFGEVNVAGRYIKGQRDSVQVCGVYEDFPENSSINNYAYMGLGDVLKDNFSNWNYVCYVRLHQGVDSEKIQAAFSQKVREEILRLEMSSEGIDELTDEELEEFNKNFDRYMGKQAYRLTPVLETYFSGVDSHEDKGNPAMMFVLQLACLLVIVIAAINFLNFTLAQSPMRVKSINTRLVLGEGLGRLRLNLIGESVLISVIACLIAIGLCALLARYPTDMLQGSIAIGDHRLFVIALLMLAVVVGLVAGVYPAKFATSFPPALALKGSFGLTPKGRKLRTGLVCLQLFISLLMVTYISILYLQSHYIYNSDYGYDKDEVVYANIAPMMDKRTAIRSELLQLSGVKAVSFSNFVLGTSDTYMGWGRGDDDHNIIFSVFPVDWQYLRTMGIEVVEGRDFREYDGDVYIINEAARKQWDWVKMDQPLLSNDLPVVGVCKDVRFTSARHDRATPMAFIVMGEKYKDWGDRLMIANIRIAANVDKVQMRKQINDLLHKFENSERVETRFLDQTLEDLYQDEFRFVRQVLIFSSICLIITLIGVFCMTMFETEYRRKEIGIRKVMGSSTGEVLLMLCSRYNWLLILSFVLAAPVAWYIGQQWLQSFAERTPIYWWLFPLALLVVAIVTMLTVVIQSWRAANENPVNSIKNE